MRIASIMCVVLVAGCGRGAVVTGTFGERQLRVGGTIAAWVDLTEYVFEEGTNTPVLVDRNTDDIVLHLLFTEAVFDPRQDLRALTAGERAALEADIARGDRLLVDVQRGNVLRNGDEIELIESNGTLPPEVLPFISRTLITLGEPVLDRGAKYPDTAPRIASGLDVSLRADETSPNLAGEITIDAEAVDNVDAEGVLEGRVTITFDTELIAERLAECNFQPNGAGVVDACTLSVP
jgi:hypothetical protein